MTTRIFRLFPLDFRIFNGQIVRHGHHIRGLPPTHARSLKQRLADMNREDPEISFKVDIGFALPKLSRREVYTEMQRDKEQDVKLEKQARHMELVIDLEKVNDNWIKTLSSKHVKRIAEHYGIFQDLFGDAYFSPVVPMQIDYDLPNEDKVARVYRGNVIKPAEAAEPPFISYEAKPDTLWTLLMTTPDGNMNTVNNEYCHWFIGNIPGNDLTKGDQIINYMSPIPPRGIGYYRYIFVLYKQNERIDYSKYKKTAPCLRLADRDWNTLEFYRSYQDSITPAGLQFFQADWDVSVQKFYHTQLQMKEPVFEYDFPKHYIKPQKWFPLRQPFNTYLDKYRDPKEINREFLLKKLRKIHPFKEPDPPLKYPNAHPFPPKTLPWLQMEIKKERLGWGRINQLEGEE